MKSVESIKRIYHKSENIYKKSMTIFVPNPRFLYFKPMSEKTKPKPMNGDSDKPIDLIRNIGSQPFHGNFKCVPFL